MPISKQWQQFSVAARSWGKRSWGQLLEEEAEPGAPGDALKCGSFVQVSYTSCLARSYNRRGAPLRLSVRRLGHPLALCDKLLVLGLVSVWELQQAKRD
jgi:hypothetical protein